MFFYKSKRRRFGKKIKKQSMGLTGFLTPLFFYKLDPVPVLGEPDPGPAGF
jgi:hypothetical protein